MKTCLKREVKTKDGRTFAKGQSVDVQFFGDTELGHRFCRLIFDCGQITTKIKNLPDTVKGVGLPSEFRLEQWHDNGIAKTPTGKTVEPDGFASDGSPSWLLALGYI